MTCFCLPAVLLHVTCMKRHENKTLGNESKIQGLDKCSFKPLLDLVMLSRMIRNRCRRVFFFLVFDCWLRCHLTPQGVLQCQPMSQASTNFMVATSPAIPLNPPCKFLWAKSRIVEAVKDCPPWFWRKRNQIIRYKVRILVYV